MPPALYDPNDLTHYRRQLALNGRSVPVLFTDGGNELIVESPGRMSAAERAELLKIVRRMFRLDDDLSPFYAMIEGDPLLEWAAREGAGRLLASPTVFEDVAKTMCTTNCAWSATIRMTSALVDLGGGTFPSPERLAKTPDAWYRDVARMGYRGPYLRSIAGAVATGELDFETFRAGSGKTAAEVEESLLQLPGIGPYAAAHIMQLAGYHDLLILDSWTRPTYLRLSGRRKAADTTIRRAFSKYKRFAGLAFWLYLTREWVDS